MIKPYIFAGYVVLSVLMIDVDAHVVNIRIHTTSGNLSNPELEVDHRLVSKKTDLIYLFNSKLLSSISGNHHLSLGCGIRKYLGKGLFGIHVFSDYGFLHSTHNFQIGPSFEYLKKRWDFRLHSYLPYKNKINKNKNSIYSYKYIDSEITYKSKYLDIGLAPNFDLDKKQAGLVGLLRIPIGNLKINIKGGYDSVHKIHSKISLDFGVYGDHEKSSANAPIYRNTGFWFKKKRRDSDTDQKTSVHFEDPPLFSNLDTKDPKTEVTQVETPRELQEDVNNKEEQVKENPIKKEIYIHPRPTKSSKDRSFFQKIKEFFVGKEKNSKEEKPSYYVDFWKEVPEHFDPADQERWDIRENGEIWEKLKPEGPNQVYIRRK